MIQLDFSQDTGEKDWGFVLQGESWDDYTKPVRLFYEQNPGADRNDCFRTYFNSTVSDLTDHDQLRAFYGGREGIFCRLLAYEMGKQGVLQQVVNAGRSVCSQHEYSVAIGAALTRFAGDRVCALDHGFGKGYVGLVLAALGFSSDLYDYSTPSRELLRFACRAYQPELNKNVRFLFIGDDTYVGNKYHLVVSMDVLEHIPNPAAELRRIRASMATDGVLLLGTFFNSCHGHDPSHLVINEHYQDTELWFSEVRNAGFELFAADPRGVPKVFTAV